MSANKMMLLKQQVKIKQQYQRFLLVGALGFCFDALLFAYLNHLLLWPLFTSRLVAFIAAVHFTWLGNRFYTFQSQAGSWSGHLKEWAAYAFSACLSAIPNLLVFKGLVSLLPSQPFWQLVALTLGVIAGCLSNYTLNRLWVFKRRRPLLVTPK
ncbi:MULTISPECIES: GtrA family protein [unclassified Vibrio]|uniref:GtrA family protein n=1 Tax=Vibrio sp. HB236076 TaxID=3232307 RepID=A0AB39HHI4_9VIBR|nr:GtrA family protein [Vibrio sp. HB161653]MDP5253156.1 GtrA family protein [Vibrio sp. HB161653]